MVHAFGMVGHVQQCEQCKKDGKMYVERVRRSELGGYSHFSRQPCTFATSLAAAPFLPQTSCASGSVLVFVLAPVS